jgi:hypothetical protein
MGPYTFGTQMLQDPVADKAMSFKDEWLKYYETLGDTSKWNKYLLVDPASSKKESATTRSWQVIGLAPDNNYYLIDAVRDRMNLTQRRRKLFEFHGASTSPRPWATRGTACRPISSTSKYEMEQKNYRFQITELGGSLPKRTASRS